MIPGNDNPTEHHQNVYRGELHDGGDTVEVTVNGESLDPRFDLHEFAPTGFGWGYGGAGPAQLALAILANEAGSWIAEMGWYRFEQEIIKRLDFHKPFELTSADIRSFLLGEPLRVRKQWAFRPWPPRLSCTATLSPY